MDFLWTVKNKEPRLLVVASEQHADGNLHRHAYLEFKERVDVTNERLFDFEGFHPSIEKGRNARNILKYCTKEGDYAIRGDKEHFDQMLKKTDRKQVAQRLMKGESTLRQEADQNACLLFGYQRLTRDLQNYLIDGNVHYEGERECVWIYGPSGTGKSWSARCQTEPDDIFIKHPNKWWCGYTK